MKNQTYWRSKRLFWQNLRPSVTVSATKTVRPYRGVLCPSQVPGVMQRIRSLRTGWQLLKSQYERAAKHLDSAPFSPRSYSRVSWCLCKVHQSIYFPKLLLLLLSAASVLKGKHVSSFSKRDIQRRTKCVHRNSFHSWMVNYKTCYYHQL